MPPTPSGFVPWLGLLLLLSMGVATRGIELQATRGQAEPVAVGLAEGDAPPDGQVTLPVSLSASEEAEVGAIDFRMMLPAGAVSFVKIDPSGLAVGVSASVQAEVKEGATAGAAIVEANISTIEPGGTRQAIPAGPVAYVTFRIAANATPDEVIDIGLEATAHTRDDPSRAIAAVKATGGRITVVSPPVPVCFFYMH